MKDKIEELGMIKISGLKQAAGFDGAILFELPEYVGQILQSRHNVLKLPEYALLRGGFVKGEGKTIRRQREDEPMRYSLMSLSDGKLQILITQTGEKARDILGSHVEYLTGEGALYAAKKYFNEI